MRRGQKRNSGSVDASLESSGGIWGVVGEICVWGWILAVLGYFYYSRGYLKLLNQIWERIIG